MCEVFINLRIKKTASIDIQREKLSNGCPERDLLVGQVQKNTSDILDDQINDSGKDRHTSASEGTSFGTFYDNVRRKSKWHSGTRAYQRQHQSRDRKCR